MDRFIVHNSALTGEVEISGSKNACLPIMAATLLTDDECVLLNVPDLTDVRTMGKILEILGKEVVFSESKVSIRSKNSKSYTAPYKLVRTMRASFCVLGPLLAKRRKANVSLPGGCVIGPRPVDLHIKGLIKLGADIKIDKGYCVGKVKELTGSHIFLAGHFGPSVLATANIMTAACLASGETVIEYSACEPEISDLALFLRAMGADIEGEGTPLIRIRGRNRLHGAEFSIIPDRIEAGTFIAASLATRSEINIKNISTAYLSSVIEAAKDMGADISATDNSIKVNPPGNLRPTAITTLPYPGFPTDLQAQFMVPLLLAKGVSIVTEKVFPDRYMHVAEFYRMGARISRTGPYAVVEGVESIHGAQVMASDLRASAALIIAGLAAEGKTEVLRIYHLDRGYFKIGEKLRKLGAKIRREKK